MIGRRGLQPGEGLWIVPSRGVHTWWMRFPIDVVALDAHGWVVDLAESLQPWRVRLPRRGRAAHATRAHGGRMNHGGTSTAQKSRCLVSDRRSTSNRSSAASSGVLS